MCGLDDFDSTGAALRIAFNASLCFLANLGRMPVAAPVGLTALRTRLGRPLPDEGTSPEAVILELISNCEGGIVGSATGRFFGWVIGGSIPAAIAADWLTTVWDQNAALHSCGPAAAVVEEVVGEWLKDLLRLPPRASFALTTGCQMAHVTCLAAARHALLGRLGWDVERMGLNGAPPIQILANNQRHGSIERAVRLLGLGTQSIVDVATTREGRIQTTALDEALRNAAIPTIVLLNAGDFHTGAFDGFDTLVPIAHRYDAWVHVDGSFGLWASSSLRHGHLTAGVDTADSWAIDGHKWLNVPFDCGYAFVADSQAHRDALSHRATYLTHHLEARDQIDWNPEWSRRARGFPTYAALRQLGRQGVAEMIERCCRYASILVDEIGALPGVEIMAIPIINQGVLRFLDPRPGASDQDHDRRTDEVIAAVAASGKAFFTGSSWHGRRVMRVSVCNWRTGERDVESAIEAFRTILASKQLPGEH